MPEDRHPSRSGVDRCAEVALGVADAAFRYPRVERHEFFSVPQTPWLMLSQPIVGRRHDTHDDGRTEEVPPGGPRITKVGLSPIAGSENLIEGQQHLGDWDSRRVVEWPGTVVYLGYTTQGDICLVIDTSPPWGTTGAVGCQPAAEAAENGSIQMWSGPDTVEGVVLVPDNATATIDQRVLIAAGDGVIGLRPAPPTHEIAATLTFADGHTSHLDITLR